MEHRFFLGGASVRRCGPLALTALLFVTACAGSREYAHPSSVNALPSGSTKFFANAYDQINEKYVRPVKLENIAEDGFTNLHKLDSHFNVTYVADRFEVAYDDARLASYERPKSDDGYRWAQLTVAVLDVGRDHSDAIRVADTETLYQTVVQGMLSHLDMYSRYSSKVVATEQRASRDGFGGIGITLDNRKTAEDKVLVASVIEGTPAALSGIRKDDEIIRIDNEPTLGLETRDIVNRLRGDIGAAVRLTVTRAGATAPIELTMNRAQIIPPSVVYRREGDIAYIHLTTFNAGSSAQMADALRRAKREIGPNMAGIVLDLRGNLGGLLDQAISTADLFLSDGMIVSTRGRHPASGSSNFAGRGQIGETVPLVVLVNGASASASEILAAALQDNNRAVVIGTTTYGKGTVQTVIPMPNDGELILTWARFFSPSGYPIADLGVMPAICTTMGQPASLYLDELRDGKTTSGATMIKWRSADHDDMAGIKQLRSICPADTKEHDADFDVAKALLNDRKLYARALSSVTLSAEAR